MIAKGWLSCSIIPPIFSNWLSTVRRALPSPPRLFLYHQCELLFSGTIRLGLSCILSAATTDSIEPWILWGNQDLGAICSPCYWDSNPSSFMYMCVCKILIASISSNYCFLVFPYSIFRSSIVGSRLPVINLLTHLFSPPICSK